MISNFPPKEPGLASEIEQVLAPYFIQMNFKAGQLLWNEGDPEDTSGCGYFFVRTSGKAITERF